eukprot:CAMPEP_0197001308 /NCGR_PEP_ID=MMETSP1380-20130617/6028_1 /TAXON_ID=5936 /ORGANISM="Euplotes crassus, Strain CT5" /LENGTH=145 /DNA_ID=CAMNT_0042418911 /DNA_START=358 /DNA_END=791 /DNA_ORIENTATION=+
MEFTILCCQIEHPELSRQLADFQIDIFIKLKRIQQQELVLVCSEQEMIQIAEFAFEKGAIIFEKYIEAITKVPLEATIDNMVDFMTEIVIYFPEQSVQWINSCLVNVPHNILSEDEKKDFCVDFEYGPDSELNIHRSFKILMKRS